MWPDDLERIYEAVEDDCDLPGSDVIDAANEAVIQGFDDARENAASIDSESALKDHIKAYERLAPRVGVPEERLKKAVSDVKGRICGNRRDRGGSIVARFLGQTGPRI
jgi:hypothetical protein